MGIVNKIIICVALFALAFGFVFPAQAGGNVSVTDIDINYDGISYEGILDIENREDKNVTVFIELFVDNVKIVEKNVSLNVTYFKGFRIKTHKTIEFELPNDVGYHNVEIHLHNGNSTEVYDGYDYEVYEEAEEEEEEEEVVEDWLKCP